MPTSKDRPVTNDHLVLLERITPARYRDWQLSLIGGIDALSVEFRNKMPTPEVELESLLALMLPGDELWLARSRVFQPDALIGNKGIAIVRNGTPVWYRIVIHH